MARTVGPLDCDRSVNVKMENGETVTLWELTTRPKDGGFTTTGYVFGKDDARLYAVAEELLEALRFVQTAIANFRDGLDYTLHPGYGALKLEEVKYCVVDPIIEKVDGVE